MEGLEGKHAVRHAYSNLIEDLRKYNRVRKEDLFEDMLYQPSIYSKVKYKYVNKVLHFRVCPDLL